MALARCLIRVASRLQEATSTAWPVAGLLCQPQVFLHAALQGFSKGCTTKVNCWVLMNCSHVRTSTGTRSIYFDSCHQISMKFPEFSAGMLLSKSRISQIWLPVDSKSTHTHGFCRVTPHCRCWTLRCITLLLQSALMWWCQLRGSQVQSCHSQAVAVGGGVCEHI